MCVSHTCISVHVSACMYVCTTRLHAHMQRCALTHAMLVGSTRNTLNREQCKHDRNMCGRDSCRRQNPTTHAFTWMLRVDRIYDRTPMRCVDLINNDVSLLLLSAIHCSIYTNSMCCIIAALKLQLQPLAFFICAANNCGHDWLYSQSQYAMGVGDVFIHCCTFTRVEWSLHIVNVVRRHAL